MIVGVGEQQRLLKPEVGDAVAAGVGDALDEVVHAQASQVVGRLPGSDVLEWSSEEGRGQGAQITVGEPVG